MRISKLKSNNNNFFEGPLILNPKVFEDSRGLFFESWNKKYFENFLGKGVQFVQDNISLSSKGVLRGIHFQTQNKQQGKLVRCTSGSIFDVIIDLREKSKTFKCWGGIEIDPKKNNQLWIPPGFGHGFLSLKNKTIVEYKVTDYWSKASERTLLWNDKTINIIWPDLKTKIKLSNKDFNGKSFKELYEKNDLFVMDDIESQ